LIGDRKYSIKDGVLPIEKSHSATPIPQHSATPFRNANGTESVIAHRRQAKNFLPRYLFAAK
jgi:hypothetical protein